MRSILAERSSGLCVELAKRVMWSIGNVETKSIGKPALPPYAAAILPGASHPRAGQSVGGPGSGAFVRSFLVSRRG